MPPPPGSPLPRVLGAEGSGHVEGRPVVVFGHGVGTTRDGIWATRAIVPRAALIDVPAGIDLQRAAVVGVAGVTAWRTVTELAQVTKDDRVLVLGAAGGVGSIIVSLVHRLGVPVWGRANDPGSVAWLTHLPQARVHGAAAGLHLTLTFGSALPAGALPASTGQSGVGLATAAPARGVKTQPPSWHSQRPGQPGLVLGYAASTPAEIEDGVAVIGSILAQQPSPH